MRCSSRAGRHLDVLVDVAQAWLGLELRPQRAGAPAASSRCPRREYSVALLHVDLRERDLVARPCRTGLRSSGPCGPGGARPGFPGRAACAPRAHSSAAWCRARSRARRCRGWQAHAVSYLMFWPSLARAGVLQPGLQPRQHLVAAAAARARRGSRAPAARRRPRRAATAKRDADDARAHAVQRIGLGVQRHQLGALRCCAQPVRRSASRSSTVSYSRGRSRPAARRAPARSAASPARPRPRALGLQLLAPGA